MHGAATTAALPSADAVLLVSDAAQEYTAPELEFLAHAGVGLPERGVRDHEDRPAPASGGASSSWTGATWPRPGSPRRSSRCRRRCAGTPSCTGDAERQRRVRLPRAGRLPAQAGARAGRPAGPARRWCTTSSPSPSRSRATCVAERTAQQDPAAVAALIRELTEAQAARDRAQGAVGALAADPQRRRRRPQRRHRLRPARPDEGDQPARRGRAARRRRPGEGVGPVRRLGAAGGRRGGVGQLHLGDAAGARAGPARSPSTSPTTASSCCRRCAATRRTRSGRCARWPPQPRRRRAWATKALTGLRGGYIEHADVRDARDARRLRLGDQPARHRRRAS